MFRVGDRVRHSDGAIGTVVEDFPHDEHVMVIYNDEYGTCTDPYSDVTLVTSKRIYLAGKMSGEPHFNFPAFHAAAAKLREQGYEVFNPAETDNESVKLNETGDEIEATKHGFCRRRALAEDTQWIALHADAIALLPGWEKSSGARAELALAQALGLKEIYL